MIIKIKKRDGREVPFNIEKISNAIFKAAQAVGGQDYQTSMELAEKVTFLMKEKYEGKIPSVENIQDMVEKVLIEEGHAKTAKEYILYRAERTKVREMNTNLMRSFIDLTFGESDKSDLSDWDNRSMSMIFRYASESIKRFYDLFVLNPEYSKAHREGIMYIHDLDFLMLTMESCNIDIGRLFENGFKIEAINIEEPKNIFDYALFLNIVMQNNQNEQSGEQSIPNFDFLMAEGIRKTYIEDYQKIIKEVIALNIESFTYEENVNNIFEILKTEYNLTPKINDSVYRVKEEEYLKELFTGSINVEISELQEVSSKKAIKGVKRKIKEALRNLFYSLNLMKPRIGGNEILSSISYGTDTTIEGRMVVKTILELNRELNISKMIYPNQVFKIKEGINFNSEDDNYDLYIKALESSLKMSKPRFSFLDTKYNSKYYEKGKVETEVTYGIKGERIISNIYNSENQGIMGRGIISSTTLNLPRIALESNGEIGLFYNRLDDSINLAIAQLLERFEILAEKKVKSFPFLMGEKLWMGSETLNQNDEIREALKNGNLSIGFIGLSECLNVFIGEDHGTSKEAQRLGLEIVKNMKKRVQNISHQYNMNFTLRGTYSKEIGSKLIEKDRKDYGIVKGITDSEYYTDGFNVKNNIGTVEKIKIEGSYHQLTEGGHLYCLNKDKGNIKLERLLEMMDYIKKSNIGYIKIK